MGGGSALVLVAAEVMAERTNQREKTTNGTGRWNLLRIKLVSIGFYVHMILVRLGVYDLVFWEYWRIYRSGRTEDGDIDGI